MYTLPVSLPQIIRLKNSQQGSTLFIYYYCYFFFFCRVLLSALDLLTDDGVNIILSS